LEKIFLRSYSWSSGTVCSRKKRALSFVAAMLDTEFWSFECT
jgi:hypothetical protein